MALTFNKIAVIGSNSFTGSNFIEYALEKTDAKILGISRSPEYNPIFLAYLYKKERPKRFTFHKLDINKDINSIIELLDNEKPEIIVNYAAQGEVRNSWNWPEQWFETNCIAIVRLSNLLKGKKYLKRYVSISTPEVYGATGNNIKENFNFRPSTPYAASKLAGDIFLYTLFKKYGFPVIFTRSSNVYGMHQQLYRIIPRTIIYLKMKKIIELHGEGKTIRSFIHVRDVADATLKAISFGKNGEVYHISPQDENYSIKEVVRIICTMMKYSFEKSTKLIKENFGQDAIFSLDSSKAKEELGWGPKISLKEGIQQVIEWIQDNWNAIKNNPLDYVHKE